jgi:xylulokinase
MVSLGIDCGTQSLRVILWDTESNQVHSTSESYDLIEGLPPGYKEQHPSEWIDALEKCIHRLAQEVSQVQAVEAIGVSGQQHGLVVLDSQDRVIRPAKLWNDTSTESQCRRILEAAGGLDSYYLEIGNGLPPGFTASKILWIQDNEPELYRRIKSLMLPHDYLNFYLTGERMSEAGDASGTGYFDVRKRRWSKRTLRWIDPRKDLSECLPRIIPSSEPAGVLRARLADKWGMRKDVVVSSGGGDNMMGAIGSGNVEPGLLTVSLGTSGTLYSFNRQPVTDPKGEIAAFCDSTGGWLPLGCTMNVTVATEMIRKSLLQVDHEGFDDAVGTVQPGCDGLFLIPFLEGERMPSVPQGCGVLLGLRPATSSPAHFARAAMEGVTMGLRYGLERMRSLGLSFEQIILIGGGARSRIWRQVVANIFHLPVVSPKIEEGPAFGAALQALWCRTQGEIGDLVQEHVVLDEHTRCLPRDRDVSTYDQLYELYETVSSRLIVADVFPQHRRLIDQSDR